MTSSPLHQAVGFREPLGFRLKGRGGYYQIVCGWHGVEVPGRYASGKCRFRDVTAGVKRHSFFSVVDRAGSVTNVRPSGERIVAQALDGARIADVPDLHIIAEPAGG